MTASYSSTSNTDLRVIKTRRAIRLAFEELLKQTDYSQITVSAIARKALINRNTFYAHYDSVDALLNELYRENIEKAWNEAMGKTSAGTGTGALNASSDLKLLTRLLLTALRAATALSPLRRSWASSLRSARKRRASKK